MDKYWPSFDTKNDKLWRYQWEKYGTCIDLNHVKNRKNINESNDDQRIFFQKTIDLFLKNRLNILFKYENYFSSNDDLIKTMSQKYKIYNAEISCQYDKKSQKQYLKEIRLKLDKDFKLFEIDKKYNSNCNNDNPIYMRRNIESNENNSQYNKLKIFNIILLMLIFIILY
jgi:hypothetical protein